MSTNARNPEKRTDPRPPYFYVGTDADGAAHYYDTRRERVHVARDGRRERVESIAGHSVDDWMAYVDSRRGWRERNYGGWGVVFARLSHLAPEDASGE